MRLAISTSPSRVSSAPCPSRAGTCAPVIGFFQRSRRQVQLDVFALFQIEVLVRQTWAVQQVDALSADGGDQVVQILGEEAISSGNISFTSPYVR